MISSEKLGAALEADCRKVFVELQKNFPFYFDRVYDTKSAQRYVPNRPGDFYIGHCGNASILECKASQKYKTFRAGFSHLTKNTQIAKQRIWKRSGNLVFYIFRSELSRKIEVWSGDDVIKAFMDSKPLPLKGALKIADYDQLEEIIYWTFIGQYQ